MVMLIRFDRRRLRPSARRWTCECLATLYRVHEGPERRVSDGNVTEWLFGRALLESLSGFAVNSYQLRAIAMFDLSDRAVG